MKYIDIQLIDRSFDKDERLSSQELEELGAWLDASEAHRAYYERARKTYKNGFERPLSSREMDRRLRKLHELLRDTSADDAAPPRRVGKATALMITSLAAAASVALIFALFPSKRMSVDYAAEPLERRDNTATITIAGQEPVDTEKLLRITLPGSARIVRGADNTITYTGTGASRKEVMNTVSVPHGSEYTVVLSDGTSVRLNAESTLTFPLRFDGAVREITLSGEACIEVAHDPQIPFVTHVAHTDITVHGTKFIASCYDEEMVETSLIEGSVTVFNVLNGNEVKLRPGQSAASYPDGRMEVADRIDNGRTAWLNGEFCFENERIEDIIAALSKWYTIGRVAYYGDDVREMRFSGSFGRDMDLRTVLELISMASDIIFNVNENGIEVNKR